MSFGRTLNFVETVELENRHLILEAVRKFPGIFLKELGRELDLSHTTVDYHARILENKNLLVSKRGGRWKFFFLPGDYTNEEREQIMTLRDPSCNRMYNQIVENPGIRRNDIIRELQIGKTTFYETLHELKLKDLVTKTFIGDSIRYLPKLRPMGRG